MRCGAFDSGLTIHPNGKISPCCVFDHRFFKTFDDIENWNDPWQDLRNGVGCAACKIPGDSYKRAFDLFLADGDFKLKVLDIRNSNLCNMECVFCGPEYSSKWTDRLGYNEKFRATDFDVNLDTVERIYFAGGEPMLNKKHWQILEQVPMPDSVSLLYSTNLSYVDGIGEYWKKFRDVQLNISIDGIDDFAEQIRPGTNWKKIEENLNTILKLKETMDINITVSTTVSLLNIWYLEDIKNWAEKNCLEWECVGLTDPNFFSLKALPQELVEKISYIPDHPHIKQMISQHETIELFNKAIAHILLGDKLRETNLWDYMPFKGWAIKHILDY